MSSHTVDTLRVILFYLKWIRTDEEGGREYRVVWCGCVSRVVYCGVGVVLSGSRL